MRYTRVWRFVVSAPLETAPAITRVIRKLLSPRHRVISRHSKAPLRSLGPEDVSDHPPIAACDFSYCIMSTGYLVRESRARELSAVNDAESNAISRGVVISARNRLLDVSAMSTVLMTSAELGSGEAEQHHRTSSAQRDRDKSLDKLLRDLS